MLVESFKKEDDCCGKCDGKLNIKELFILAIATSIDALAVGLTFSLYPNIKILPSIAIIGIVTFIICALGVLLGHLCVKLGGKFGPKFQFAAELVGGCVLLGIGIKLLVEGLIA